MATTNDSATSRDGGRWLVRFTVLVLAVDVVVSVLIMSPLLPWVRIHDDLNPTKFVFSSSLKDLLLLCWLRVLSSVVAFLFSFLKGEVRPEYPFDILHPNGTKKSQEELDEEFLEQPFRVWFGNYIHRAAFPTEFLALVTTIVSVVKCLVRLNLEIGILRDALPLHPLYWCAILFASVMSLVEFSCCDRVVNVLSQWGQKDRENEQEGNPGSFLRQISSQLSLPLLANDSLTDDDDNVNGDDEEGQQSQSQQNDENAAGVSDLDSNYKASWTDLIMLCSPDAFLILIAFVFLVLAAAAQILIPYFIGNLLTALEKAYSGNDDDDGHGGGHDSITDVPGFTSNVKKLIIVSILGGVFSGVRGSIFTVVGGRVNVRMRLRLMDSLLTQDQGFYDVTKTGDITSRLSSDTTLVGDQVTLNVNVFLRSLVQIVGVLIFMFRVSWQLSILAFISVPVITILSKSYGNFIRSLTKVMQTKLAEGNSISDQAISNYSTVRGFDGQKMEYDEFSKKMQEYLTLTVKSAFAYSGYATVATSLPQLVTALVVFFGGLMVRNGDITSGSLVSFLLYLSSLSDSFSSIGYIFSSLTMAVGAADKVFELMHRKPKRRPQSSTTQSSRRQNNTKSLIDGDRSEGIEPDVCRGEIELRDVELYYPARPQRRVLNGMSMVVPPGKIVALVGSSGGGKSSALSLVQNTYNHSAGRVLIDGVEVHELSPRWLTRHVSSVQQEPTLFARSIKRNIIYGLEGTDREPSMQEIQRVAKLASCDDFIQNMPMKYDTEVGERGAQLSGGQKQRIAIARALIRKPKVLLLDEATSALDAESEHQVQAAIDHMIESARSTTDEGHKDDGSGGSVGGMTVMIVAHRLSTVKGADIILVCKEGRIVERGSHHDLLKKDGDYAALVRRQMNVQSKLEKGSADIDVIDEDKEA